MWLALIWTLFIYGLVFGVIYWMAGVIESKVAIVAPFMWLVWLILTVAAGVFCIGILLGSVPLIPFGQVGAARIY